MSYAERLLARQATVGRPVRVALVGAGQMGRGLAAQVGRMPGLDMSEIADVDPGRARPLSRTPRSATSCWTTGR
jgi:predicted homoserine dehydrogenase-like protein